MMTDYKVVAAQLGRVRRAWKRTAAWVGLAVTVLETAGMFTVLLLVDLLFRPGQQGRLALAAALAAAAAVLVARHVLRPLFRRIPDEQVALYVEEHNPGFEGALIAAAQFGQVQETAGRQAIVAAILREAERRAGRLDVRQVVSLARLRKYAWSAAAVLVAYGAAGLVFPQTVGRHAVRVIAPWKAPDAKPVPVSAAPAVKPPIDIALSVTNADVLRGASFRLEAALSRDPDAPVQLHFRSFAEGAAESRWYAVPMKSVEKVRGYEAVLPDINEDMECYVSAERFKSPVCRIRVYDPLAVEGVETSIRYPAYLQLPDLVERGPSGDVAAPEGAIATLRVAANRPLKAGRLDWVDGAAQPMQVTTNEPNVGVVAFPITTNRAYRFRVEDAMGQIVTSPEDVTVRVLPDTPPTIVLTRPVTPPESVLPIGDLTVETTVSDDFGVAGVDLIYRIGAEQEGSEQRVALAMPGEPAAPGAEATASVRLRLETLQPRLQGGEVIAWHVEARDRKGQTAATDLIMTPVRYLDMWATEEWEPPHAPHPEEQPPSLLSILQTAFQIAAHRGRLAPREVERQMDELGQTMMHPTTGKVWIFVKTKPGTPPAMAAKIQRVNELAAKGHDALASHALDPAVDELRRAVMLMISLGLLQDPKQILMPPADTGALEATANPNQQEIQALAEMEKQAAKETQNAPKDKKMEQADKTEELQKKIDGLATEQKKLTEKARELEKKAPTPAGETAPQPKGAAAKAADEQQKLASKVREAAEQIKQDKTQAAAPRERTAEALHEAARKMDSAAHSMNEGRMEKAVKEAEDAHRKLSAARDELGTEEQEKLAKALATAEKKAGQILNQQKALAKATEAAGRNAKSAQLERDMQALGAQQARTKADIEGLQDAVNVLKDAVDKGTVRPETAAHIQAAEHEMRRGRAAQKAANAAVAMAAQQPQQAAAEQQKIAATMEKVHDSLRQASDSTATGFEAELRRAKAEAEKAQGHLAELQQPPPKAGADPAARREQAEAAVDTASRLERHAQARDFLSQPVMTTLHKEVQRAQGSGRGMESDKATVLALADVVKKARAELETAYGKLLENKRLFSSQREECPPQYRPLVNKYFEALSE